MINILNKREPPKLMKKKSAINIRHAEILKAFSFEIRKTARMSAINTSFQHCTGCPNQHSNVIKRTKWHKD